MGEKQNNIKKLDYAWDLWKLNYRKSLRQKILQSDDDRKVEIAKEIGLEYPFLLKRQVNMGFRNLIYNMIISDKKQYRKILAELMKLVSTYIMDQEEIERIISSEGLWSELKMDPDTYDEKKGKDRLNQLKRALFMKHLLELKLSVGDLEECLLISAELNELTAKSSYSLTIAPYFAERVISYNIDANKKYDYIMKGHGALNLKNYRRYVNFDKEITPHLPNSKEILGYQIKLKILNQVFGVFEVEKSPEMFLHYHQFIQNLLAIGSWIFFNTLNLKERLKLLNREFGVKNFINYIIGKNIQIEKSFWKLIIDDLSNSEYFQEALELMEYIQKTLFPSFNRLEKSEFFYSLGNVYFNSKSFVKAIETFTRYIKLEGEQKYKNQKFIQTLILAGECYANLNDQISMEEKFNDAVVVAEKFDNSLRFFTYYSISLSYRHLGKFRKEREYLKKATDLLSGEIGGDYLDYLDLRTEAFLETKMNTSELKEIENILQAQKSFDLGKNAMDCFYHKEATKFFRICLKCLKNTKETHLKFLTWKNLGFSYFLLRDWKKMYNSFEKALSIKNEDYLSLLYFSIASYFLGKLDLTRDFLSKACRLTKENEEKLKLSLENITLDLINSMGQEKFLNFISLLENVEEDERWDFIYHFGNFLANYGFHEIGIILFNKELQLTKDNDLKAKYYNNIGTVYSDLTKFDLAFEFFEKAVATNPEYAFCYRNMAQTYVRMSEFAKAITFFEKAIEVAQKKGDEENASFYKNELEAVQTMLKHSLMIDKISDEDIKKLMITAEMLYFNYWQTQSNLDASLILIEYGKSLELMLHKRITPVFDNLIRKYKSQFFSKKLSNEVRKKFANLFYSNSLGLGDWDRILKAFRKLTMEKKLKEFKDSLYARYDESELKVINNACEFIVKERNPSSHIKIHEIDYVIKLRTNILELLNKAIEVIFRAVD